MKDISHLSRLIYVSTYLFFFSLLLSNSAQAIEVEQLPYVKKLIQAFKQNDRIVLSKMVSYPLSRPAPLPAINNPNEFLKRFDEVFDKKLISTIAYSNPHADWDSIGWRGVILENGLVSLDPEGNITEINYQSQRELALVKKLNEVQMAKGRRSIHRSVNNYQQALVQLTTKRFHIRVDDIGNGQLRYASWPLNKTTNQPPDLILNNGRIVKNGRNQRYVFNNGSYSYHLNINNSGINSKPTASLEVLKEGSSVLHEVATQIISR